MKTKVKKWGCVSLFFAPFVFVGLFTLFSGLKSVYDVIRSEKWIETEARIIDLEIEYNSRGNSKKVLISYEYEFEKQKYKGNQLLFGYSMNSFESHGQLYNILSEANKIKLFINPETPKESVIIREFNKGILFLLVFSIMWNSIVFFFLFQLLSKKKETEVRQKNRLGLVILFAIWVAGIFIIFSSHIPIEDKIIVTEKKTDIESFEF